MFEDPLSALPWVFAIGFAAFWVLLFRTIAWWGGWSLLAGAYPSHATPAGDRLRMRSAQLRAGCNYNNCITFVASPAGLHLSMPLFFHFGHAPLFLPWSELNARRERVWLVEVIVLRTRREPDVPIKLRARLGERLLAHAGTQLPIEPASSAPPRGAP